MYTGTGGPAFPATLEQLIGHQDNGVPVYGKDSYLGMTLRDYFAAQALQGVTVGSEVIDPTGCAKWCYEMADAMLAERNKT